TNRDLQCMVARGAFREDLYYRLRVLPLTVPPLRARGSDDLELLIHHFVRRTARRFARPGLRLAREALARLLAHDWPGNVRELEHCLEGAAVLASNEEIQVSDLPLPPRARPVPTGDAELARLTWTQMERRYSAAVMSEHGG